MNKILRVSDHAVLRYLERIDAKDVEAIRRLISAQCEPTHAVAETIVGPHGTYVVKGAHAQFIVANRVVVTTLERDAHAFTSAAR